MISPQGGSEDDQAPARLAVLLNRLHEEGWEAVGQLMDPDPYTAVQNALQYYPIDEIVISTLPEQTSGWLRGDLIGRVRSHSDKPVEHVVVTESEAQQGAVA